MHENALMRQLAERRELKAELVRMDNPQADLEQYRFELLQRADHFAIAIARASPPCREDVLAIAELVYDENGREIRMTETITERREPDFMAGVYTTQWGKTIIVNHFEDAGDSKTRWVVYANHFFKGMMKLLIIFFARSIRRRTEDDLQRFELLVESEQMDEPS